MSFAVSKIGGPYLVDEMLDRKKRVEVMMSEEI
jgi:hypothetical protein